MITLRILIVLSVLFNVLNSITTGAHASGKQGANEQKYAVFTKCPIQQIQDTSCRIGYRTYGKLNPKKNNAILVPTWFGGVSSEYDNAGFIGSGKMLDSSLFYIIVVDAFGNGVSASPSLLKPNVAKTLSFTIQDMVKAQQLLVTQELRIKHLHAVVGISMGGMQTLQWARDFPNFMDKAVSIIGSVKSSYHDQMSWQHQIDIIEALSDSKIDAEVTLDILAQIGALTYFSPEHVEQSITEQYGTPEAFLNAQKKYISTANLPDMVSQMRAMITHNALAGWNEGTDSKTDAFSANLLLIVAPDDRAVTPSLTINFSKEVGTTLVMLNEGCGHFSLFCETERISKIVNTFLSK